ncbi:MAG: S8 family peptidase [Bacteroidota bacterium]
MNRIQSNHWLLCLSILFLSSCGGIQKLAVPSGADTVVNLPGKKVRLTQDQLNQWSYVDLAKDTVPGISLMQAYDFVKDKTGETVIVAVADTGLDVDHEDLKNQLWRNDKEIAGNGKDDDNNGYIDDLHGWNYLGDTYKENLEITRMVRMYQDKFGRRTAEQIPAAQKEEFNRFKALEADVSEQFKNARSKHYYDLSFNARGADAGAAYIFETPAYGNGDVNVSQTGESHGSHVAGIIGAQRANGKGMDGIAANVKIMSLRMVPDGDEYDKDVAMAIRYAADNGAKVVNTSFGKGYSPKKDWVYEAIKYAAEKDVLIVNAAGNSGANIDVEKTFPNDAPDLINEVADNVLTVGALSPTYSEKMVARFSNYGKLNVDVFAPGVQVYSTVPDGDYGRKSGTSMAAPTAAGVAALVRSYYPQLSASQVKRILMNSGTKVDMEVIKPGTKSDKIAFSELSVSGRILNAHNALMMADKMVNKK